MGDFELRQIGPYVHEVERDRKAGMRVPARVFADATLLAQIRRDRSLQQLVNVTTLPGIYGPALGMPDMHEGYGFPVGGVAATRAPDGVISPGGIGFDINCGVRLLASDMRRAELAPFLTAIVHDISRSIPTGFGRSGRLALAPAELDRVLAEGCGYVVDALGLGVAEDLDFIESRGCLAGADPAAVSERAKIRGHDQLGTLGGGNHFVEVQVVDTIFDDAAAAALGLFRDQITVLIHTGSRGLGHQVCSDYVRIMDETMALHGIAVPDRQLACAPLSSAEGRRYFAAMCAAANFGWSNRQVIAERVRQVFARALAGRVRHHLRLVYDVAHNTAKLERFGDVELCVHRKGATRAFGPGHPDVPEPYRSVGQPVLVGGSMGTASYVLAGASDGVAFSSAVHGAGRTLSRHEASRRWKGRAIVTDLASRGIIIRSPSLRGLAEEAPGAYKDISAVVDAAQAARLARKVAKLVPLACVKG
jgi:tRNA-splicing ligase RtcB